MSRLGLHLFGLAPRWSAELADTILPPAVAHGVSAVELPLTDPGAFNAVETRRAVERNRLEAVISTALPWDMDIIERRRDATEFLDAAIECAREAGAAILTGVVYGAIGKRSGRPPREREGDAICRLVDHAARTARRVGIGLGLKPSNRYETHLLNTARQAAWIIERVGAGNVFVHLDTFDMNMEERGLAAGIADAGEHLGYVSLSESNRGVAGEGTLDWVAVFAGLKDIGYDGIMTLESHINLSPDDALRHSHWRSAAEHPVDVVEKGLPFLVEKAGAAGIVFETP